MHSDSASNRWDEPGLASIAARLLKDGFSSTESFITSPACLYAALEMLARGAKGKTLEELESVLGDAETRQEACSLLFEDNPKNAPSDYRLNIATSLWANKHSALCAPAFPGYNRHERSDCRSGLRTTRGQRPIVGMARQEHREQVRLGARTRQRHRIAIIGTLHFKTNWVDRLEDGGGRGSLQHSFRSDRHDHGQLDFNGHLSLT